jgi:hypothetical protein
MDLPPAACLYMLTCIIDHNRKQTSYKIILKRFYYFCLPSRNLYVCIHKYILHSHTHTHTHTHKHYCTWNYLGVGGGQPQDCTTSGCRVMVLYIEPIYEKWSLPRHSATTMPISLITTYMDVFPRDNISWSYVIITGWRGRGAVNFHRVVCCTRWRVRHSECYPSYSQSIAKVKGHIIKPLGKTCSSPTP